MVSKSIILAIALALPFMASAQHDYISSSGNVYLVNGSTERYGSPDIYVDAVYHSLSGTSFIVGNGLGTSPTINDVTGTNNGFAITFTRLS